jgi:hypothetical protein
VDRLTIHRGGNGRNTLNDPKHSVQRKSKIPDKNGVDRLTIHRGGNGRNTLNDPKHSVQRK